MTKQQRASRRMRLERLERRDLLAVDSLVISEFMASNDTVLLDNDGEFSDWIEIHNPTAAAVNLEGWSLSDREDDLSAWRFPRVELPAGEYLVVFASGKDRRDSGSPLHTNFRLSAEGESLVLADPDGNPIHAFAPSFPTQSADISFGLPIEQSEILTRDGSGRMLIPGDAEFGLGTTWTQPAFDDSGWLESSGSVGYERRQGFPNVGFEDGDFTSWGVNGQATVVSAAIGQVPPEGQRQALLRATQDSTTRFTLETFLGANRFDLDNVGNGPVTRGTAIRRTVDVQAGSTIRFDWNFLSDEPSIGGSRDFAFVSIVPGPGIIKLADIGNLNHGSSTEFDRETGYQPFEHTFQQSGTYQLGFGVVNQQNRFLDSAMLVDNLLIDGQGSITDTFQPLIATDVGALLADQASSLWLRRDFEVTAEALAAFSTIVLRSRFDDGMILYVNGQEVVSTNAPANGSFRDFAPLDRSVAEALQPDDVLLPISLFHPGRNVLAAHVFKSSLDDPNLLADFSVIGLGDYATTGVYLPTATPGKPNLSETFSVTDEVQFSAERGFYDSPFDLTLSTSTVGASVRYTLDGSAPSPTHGTDYDGPVRIAGSTVVRAMAFKDGLVDSRPTTQTYLFVDDAVTQSQRDALARGFPAMWGDLPADYEMDRRIAGQNGSDLFGGRYASTIRDDLLSAPTLSIVMNMDDLFSAETGIYSNPIERGVEWERPTSLELIYPDGRDGFQIDAGIRIQGGISRFISSKSSLRLLFKEEYGPSKLEFPLFGEGAGSTFDSISLRSSSGEHLVGIHYIRDEFLRRSQLMTGNLSSHGNYMHLYINGLYWGMYNPVERIDAQFAVNYLGGQKEDYDVLNAGDLGAEGVSAVAGSLDSWNTMISLARNVATARTQTEMTAAYFRLQGKHPDGSRNPDWEVYLDAENYIDYLITQVYARNTDWPIRNYYMLRRRGLDSEGFQFLVWDAEFTIDQGRRTSIDSIESDGPGRIFNLIRNSEVFRTEFADRVQQHFSEGGAYYVNPANPSWNRDRPDDNVPAALYAQTADEVFSPLVADSARWGDERAIPAGSIFTRDIPWARQVDFNLSTFFATRSTTFLTDVRTHGFYVDPPQFSVPPGQIDAGTPLALTSTAPIVYYTLDGSDPRLPDGSVSPTAIRFVQPITVDQRMSIATRSLNGTIWSALGEGRYYTDSVPANASNLRIAELNYNPHDAMPQFGELEVDNDEFEFVELVNISDRQIELEGVRFAQENGDGIGFVFGSQNLPPQGRVVIPKNLAAFVSRYGELDSMSVGITADADQWVFDGRLGNGGETIVLWDANGRLVQRLTYADDDQWPGRADGNGSSLEAIDPQATNETGGEFRSSSEFGGSPGTQGQGIDERIVINELLASPQAGGVDQVELYNRTEQRVSLAGWYLSDSNNDYLRFQFSQGTELGPGQYLTVTETEFDFKLNGTQGEDLYLIESDARGKPIRFVDRVEFNATDTSVTLGRWPNGTGRLFPMQSNTLGAVNSGPLTPQILISEVMYAPPDPDSDGALKPEHIEFVELHNPTDAPVDLSGWQIEGDVDAVLPTGTILQPNGVLVVVPFDAATDNRLSFVFRFTHQVGEQVKLWGPYSGSLPDQDGVVRLTRPVAIDPDDPDPPGFMTIDEVRYEHDTPWPARLEGTRNSLQRLNPSAFGSDPASWLAASRSPGEYSPSEVLPGDVNLDRLVDDADIDQLCAAILGRRTDPIYDLNRDGQVNRADHDLLIGTILGTRPGDSNLDGIFNSTDLVYVFLSAEYEDGIDGNSRWKSGDWNCDGDFSSADFVTAFLYGGYSNTAQTAVAAQPEPELVSAGAFPTPAVAPMHQIDANERPNKLHERQRLTEVEDNRDLNQHRVRQSRILRQLEVRRMNSSREDRPSGSVDADGDPHAALDVALRQWPM